MATKTSALKQERMHLRLDRVAKRKIERAAAYAGKSTSDFVLSSVVDAADRVLAQNEAITLSEQDWNAFYESLMNPPPLTPTMRRAIKRYQARSR